jgi:type II secretion system protein J
MNQAIGQSILQNPRAGAAAFTLIELLIAVGISAAILVVVNGVFFSALRLRNGVTAAASQTLPVDTAVAIMKRDLISIVPVGVLAGPMGTDATGVGMTASPSLEIFTSDGVLTADQPWGDVQKIDYSLQTSTDRNSGGRDLLRGVTRNLLPSANNVAPDQQTLLTDVQNLTFSYYDGTNWNDTWSTTLSNIPVAIKVTIDFATSRNDTQIKPSVQFLVPIVTFATTNAITNQISN